MKLLHYVGMRVFSKEEDDEELIIRRIKKLFPFDFKKEKIKIEVRSALGFEDKKIRTLKVNINKERHTNKFIKNLMLKLGQEQKELLRRQLESRLDESLHFYLRLDKDKLLEDEHRITDSENCFHFKRS